MGEKKNISKIEKLSRQVINTWGPNEQAAVESRHILFTKANFEFSSPNLGKRQRWRALVFPVSDVSSPDLSFKLRTGIGLGEDSLTFFL